VDRNTAIGLSLMFLIMMSWFWYMTPSEEQLNRLREESRTQDSLRAAQATLPDAGSLILPEDAPLADESADPSGIFAAAAADTVIQTVSTPLYTAVFSNVGGGPARFELKTYSKWDGTPVQMISDTTRSAYSMGFVSTQNYNIETRNLVFTPLQTGDLVLETGGSATLTYVYEPEPGARLVYEWTFQADTYAFDLHVRFEGMERFLSDRNLELGFVPRLNSTEKSQSSEGTFKSGYVYSAEVLEQVIRTKAGREEKIFNGETDWIASKTKFFTQIIKPQDKGTGAVVVAELTGEPSAETTEHTYATTLRWRLPDSRDARFHLYMGPLEYDYISKFDTHAYEMVEVGYAWINWFSRPFVKYLILPVMTTLNDWLGNMGLAIIVFSILIKIILHYPTKKSFESMAAMRELQPEMKLIQEKYKDDPQKQQQATMDLFKKAKVNPLGGCLPNLLQLPVLLTLWRFFSNAIEIRGESFLWASDLSAPDVILNLPFSIPFMGDHIAGFVLLMTASMVWQMKISGQGGASNPQMKVFIYVLPVMLLVMFNNFASGLSLYYLLYNLLSIGQQYMINQKIDHAKLMADIEGGSKKKVARSKSKKG
jgi:YidC/Oxa1 family membrane protein insertase